MYISIERGDKMGVNEFVNIGSKIKKLRIASGYNQTQFAKMLEIPRTTYINYENGHREPSKEIIKKIANTLNVDINDLLGINNNAQAAKLDETKWVSIKNEDEIKKMLSEDDIFSLKKEIVKTLFESIDAVKNYINSNNMDANNLDNIIKALSETMDFKVRMDTSEDEPKMYINFIVDTQGNKEGE